MLSHVSDAELVLRAKNGDQGALTQIYERYASAIYRYIYYRVGEVELAEDLQADVFLRMLEGMHGYEERGWPISAWLYRIAHDRTIDWMRRRHIRYQVPLDYCEDSCEGPEHTIDQWVRWEELRHVLDDLTNAQRQVILLRFLSDLSVQEVAERLGRSEGAVKALQHRGIQSLARLLQTHPPSP